MFSKLKAGLNKFRQGFVEKVEEIFTGRKPIDEELLEELEETMIQADVGIKTTMELVDKLRAAYKKKEIADSSEVKGWLQKEIALILQQEKSVLRLEGNPAVILVVGVNGVGKTTSIGKIATKFRNEGRKVLIAAADTFRAAAIEQLEVWGNRANVDVIKHHEGADPGAVVFDALQAAKARKSEIIIVDTAGRLHTKDNLMEELKKIKRIVERETGSAPSEVLLVLDATTGQNGLSQAKNFKEAVDVTGIVLTKLDGTAKGGVVIAIGAELGLPIKFIGVGEGVDDLQEFDSEKFVTALFGENA
ncbi:MAG: signal recognition particle-docking protein FtsY [bacterium]